ncbi:3-hydroxyacyl-ACP dehydratase FabZ family protein [Robiginitalea sp. SC105]|uniref:3-hydroxyacyl-ACP dehydratase FabZ family protein n=1 Tax=Robiginitalea sp. SC105 TaxID=2762332 RepID=UPI00351CAEE3
MPYRKPFLFVDNLISVGPEGAEGYYTFPPDSWFYQGHFPQYPVTPGVLLTECCAQIGVVCLGIYLAAQSAVTAAPGAPAFALSDSDMDFLRPVLPGERVRVVSRKEYFRFGKLRCRVQLFNEANELACKGQISGMIQKGNP